MSLSVNGQQDSSQQTDTQNEELQQADSQRDLKDWRATLNRIARAYEKKPAALTNESDSKSAQSINSPKSSNNPNNPINLTEQNTNIKSSNTRGVPLPSAITVPILSQQAPPEKNDEEADTNPSSIANSQEVEREPLVVSGSPPVSQQELTQESSQEPPAMPEIDEELANNPEEVDLAFDPAEQLSEEELEPLEAPEIPEDETLLRRFAPGEELVLSVIAAGFAKGEVFAITTEDSFRIGLLELSEVLDFAIDLSDDSREASGWYISPTNGFTLSINEQGILTANSAGVQSTLSESGYEIDGDLMVDAETMSQWFGLTFELDESKLLLVIESSLPLPFEAAERRKQRRLSGNFKTSVSVLPPIDNSYQLFTPPLLDFQSFIRASDGNTNYGYSVVSRQDFAYLSSNLFIAGDKNDSLRDARLTFYKESPEGEMLGPLGLTEISIGDVLPINAGISNTSGFGRGISVSNIKEQIADNRQVNFTGLIQAGWDIELYRNGILLENEFDIQTGRYEFTDIALLFGSNDFELVFYGPQGQIERRNESYIVDQNALRANQNSFRFSAVDSNKTLLGVTDIVDDPTLEGFNAGLVYDRGITNWYTLGVGASILEPQEGETVEQFSIRNNLSFGRIGLLNSVILMDNDNRRNLLANFRTRIGETNLALDWQSNRVPVVENDVERTTQNSSFGVTVSGKFFAGTSYTIGHENIWRRTTNATAGDTETFRQSLSMVTSAGSFNHSFIGSKADTFGNEDWIVNGEFGYRNRFGRFFTRLFSSFAYRPEFDLQSVGAAVNYPISNAINSEFRYAYNVIDSSSSYNARINWQMDYVTLSSFATYNDSDNWSLNLTARFGLGLNSNNDALLLTSRPISQAGALAVRVFEDLDLDREYDEGEPLIDDVQIRAAQVSRSDATTDGTAFLNRLPNNRRTDIVVDETTLPDYTYLRLDEGFSVTGRRGLLQFADIPFTRGGELDGTVYFVNKEGTEEPLPYVTLNLVNEDDEIVATTKSEFDGFYIFEKVIPGDYRLFIDERVLNQRNAIQEVTKSLNISNQGDLFTDVDLVLRELSKAKGYLAIVGEFRSLTLLKVYYGLLQKRVPPELLNDVFYMAPTLEHEYRIAISFSEEELRAERSCEYAAQYQIECSVQYVEFGY